MGENLAILRPELVYPDFEYGLSSSIGPRQLPSHTWKPRVFLT